MSPRQLPPTRGAERFKKLLAVLAVASIAFMTLAVNRLVSELIDLSLQPTREGWIDAAMDVAQIAGAGVILWIAYRGRRHNLAPPEWAMLAVVLLSWAAILLPKL
jgi:hypothetical protein